MHLVLTLGTPPRTAFETTFGDCDGTRSKSSTLAATRRGGGKKQL